MTYDAILQHFPTVPAREQRLSGLTAELKSFHLSQEKLFADREQALVSGYAKLHSAIEEAQASANARVAAAQKKFDERQAALESDYEAKMATLRKEREQLEAERKELDDRQRMHARRKHEEVLKELVEKQKEFAVSKATVAKRKTVGMLCALGLGLGIVLYTSVAVAVLVYERELTAFLWSMLATATFLVGSTLVFALRWTNSWFQTHADFETRALTFNQDFTRASWLVEFLFEWQKENPGSPVPDNFLKTLVSRLFDNPGATQVEHPLAEMLTRLSHVQSVEVGKKHVRIERDGSK